MDSDDEMEVSMLKRSEIKTPFYKLVKKPKSSSVGVLKAQLRRVQNKSQGPLMKEFDTKWAAVINKTKRVKDRSNEHVLKTMIKRKETKLKSKLKKRNSKKQKYDKNLKHSKPVTTETDTKCD